MNTDAKQGMLESNVKFGTDGIRGSVEEDITPQLALQIGWATGTILNAKGGKLVLIGKDTRVSGYMLESALEAGFIAAGINVTLVGPLPTPGIAYLTQSVGADIGVVISASHNPFYDNGIKLFNAEGDKIDGEFEQGIQDNLNRKIRVVEASKLGKASRINDATGRYIEYCKRALADSVNLSGMRLMLDCANGAGYQVLPNLLRELGAEVKVIHNIPDGYNINANCGSTSPEALRLHMRESGEKLGIAIDGDADRLLFMDENGIAYDGDDLLYLLAKSTYARNGQAKKGTGVVGTILSNYGLDAALADLGIELVRTAVGDRHVATALNERNWDLGAEESGHIISLQHNRTSDASIAAVRVLDALKSQGLGIAEATSGFVRTPRQRRDMRVFNPEKIVNSKNVQQVYKQLREKIDGQGQVILRPSGTESMVRLVVDAQNESLAQEILEQLVEVIEAD